MLKKIFTWIIASSADPKKVSLSVKAILLGVIPYTLHAISIACGVGWVCLDIDGPTLNSMVEIATQLVFYIFSIIAIVGSVYGVTRKLILTIKGQNKAIQ